MIAIETNNLSKNVGNSSILRNINIKLKVGNIYGIVGDNFSGRIELLKTISGIHKDFEGEVKVLGNVIKKDSNYLDNIGMSFSSDGFINEYTGFKNLKIIASIKGDINEGEIKDALCMVGLLSLSREKVSEYSLEMKKKLLIAQAIMEKPKVIIIDEPFEHLKDKSLENISYVLREMSSIRKTTIVLGSRSEMYLEDVCSHIFNIKAGIIES